MTNPDEEFDDFLRRRRPMFGRDEDLEPPLELDRKVLRQARDALESERPQRVFRAPSWGMPVAMAATLVLAFTIILRVNTAEVVKKPEVMVQTVSRQIEIQPGAATPPPAPEMARAAAPAEEPAVTQANDSGAMVVDIGADNARAERDAAADAMAAPAAKARARSEGQLADTAQPARDSASGRVEERIAPAANAASAPAQPDYRRDAKSWLAEIDRLRAAGDRARADAELAEYKREHRAYAVSPDR